MAPRTALLHPDRYFAERDPELARGLAIAALVTLAAVLAVAGLGAVFTAKIDGTVLVDNPDKPPEAFCEGGLNETFESMNTSMNSSFDCGGPDQVEQDIDPIITDAVGQFYGAMLIGMPLVVLVAAVLLHVGTALADGSGSFAATLTVTAWGFATILVSAPVALVLLWVLMEPVTVTPGVASAALRSTVVGALDPWLPVALAVNAVGSIWGAVIWTFGLERTRNVSRVAAAGVAALVTLGLFVFGAL